MLGAGKTIAEPFNVTTSLIIITKDKPAQLRLTLLACMAHAPIAAGEIIIVNDGEDQNIVSAICKAVRDLPLKCVRGPRLGRAAARNAGAANASGSMLIFIDDDILTNRNFVAAHLAAQAARDGLVRGRLRELIGAAVGVSLSGGGSGFQPIDEVMLRQSGFQSAGYRLVVNQLERAIELRFCGNETRLPPWLASAGANFSISRELWERTGGQEERFGTKWGCEDLEFSCRLHKHGVRMAFTGDATGFHLSHPQPERWSQHAVTSTLFRQLHPSPEVAALDHLLGPEATVERYLEALKGNTCSV